MTRFSVAGAVCGWFVLLFLSSQHLRLLTMGMSFLDVWSLLFDSWSWQIRSCSCWDWICWGMVWASCSHGLRVLLYGAFPPVPGSVLVDSILCSGMASSLSNLSDIGVWFDGSAYDQLITRFSVGAVGWALNICLVLVFSVWGCWLMVLGRFASTHRRALLDNGLELLHLGSWLDGGQLSR